MKTSHEISAKAKKTRKWWLVTLLVFSVPNFLIHIFGFAMLVLAHMSSDASPKDFYFVYIVSGVTVLLSGLVIYLLQMCLQISRHYSSHADPDRAPVIYGTSLYKFLQSNWEWKHL
jgi:hypothetical protein